MRYLLTLAVLAAAACGEVSSPVIDATPPIDTPATCDPACGVHATCQGTTCVCDPGYALANGECADIDECAVNNGGCDANALCTNTDGDNTCACNAGYLGDGATCRQVWALQGTFPWDINPSNFGSDIVVHNSSVFIGIETNTPTAKGWRSFNTANLTLSGPLALPPSTDDDFCACGATQTIVSDGTFIYMFGNYAVRYDPSANRWTTIAGYISGVDYRRAESASVWNSTTNRAEMFGNRGPEAATLNFTPPSTFAFGTNLPIAVDSARAYVQNSSGLIFLAGGQQQGGMDRIMSRPANIEAWTIHASAPGSIGSVIGVGEFGPRIWAAGRGSEMYFYNPASMTWDRTIGLPPRTQRVATTPQGTFAFVHTATAQLEVYKLANIE